ncbi:putative O-methyltransferase YrrM [Maribacter vaceletii]|uniref:Putative O-methyltransferase YrrM n=1 Tax=Maribacter vaceletii TaxID=1206816 RepID=A0A495EES9_9FLAO|nr:class I SAM-dependent methyltransferase [Maribacter vaceletii]RKR15398.1 putative O-methyltransferase YrrM [Maribacter vaceletii]
MNTISNKKTTITLNKLHKESSSEKLTIMKGAIKGIFRELRPSDMEDAYIAITKEQGEYIYDLLIREEAKNIIEFGTSFGISTIYLAAAAKENNGHVITTELLESKANIAHQNFKDADVGHLIDLRIGDAMNTLLNVPNNIDFLLLDGWNDLYLPLIKILEPKLKKGAYIYTDNINFTGSKPFVEYIQSHPKKYRTKRLSEAKGGAGLTQYLN